MNAAIEVLETRKEKDKVIKTHGVWMKTEMALVIAHEIKEVKISKILTKLEYRDAVEFSRPLQLYTINELDKNLLFQPLPVPPLGLCTYNTAAELMASCPTREEIQKIRHDFNIYFENELITNGILVPWRCTSGGNESSLMLSMYNAFRLLMCIPFDETFPWAPEHNNLYEWLKSLELTAIGYFWAEEGEFSTGWNKRIYLTGNILNDPIFREVINSQSWVGIITHMALIVHEARHAGYNIGHNCGSKDTDLEYIGAWAVHYYLFTMLAENTGDYFSLDEKDTFLNVAQLIYDNKFCNLE